MSDENWRQEVIDFWFVEIKPEAWFERDEDLDATITKRFGSLHERLAAMDAAALADTPQTALASIIVLDQFSRNMFRGSPKSFEQDAKALAIANMAIAQGFENELDNQGRYFIYMPFMHSEALPDQDRGIQLFHSINNENGVKYAKLHREVILEFGRFPHRNAMLGRTNTPEEQRWLDAGGGFG